MIDATQRSTERPLMPCAAPGCAGSGQGVLCDPCTTRVEDAMRRAVPLLLDLMTEARSEVAEWLAAPRIGLRQWVMHDADAHVDSLGPAVDEMVADTEDRLGFIDPAVVARYHRDNDRHGTSYQPSVWRVGTGGGYSETETGKAWRAHAGPILKFALMEALDTFPTAHAAQEIKQALLQAGDYGPDDADEAVDEILAVYIGGNSAKLSDDADSYLRLRYGTGADYLCDAEEAHDFWWRFPALPPEIMAVLDAARAAEAEMP